MCTAKSWAGEDDPGQTPRSTRDVSAVLTMATNPLPAIGRQVGIDVGIVSFVKISDGEHLDNPRWGVPQLTG